MIFSFFFLVFPSCLRHHCPAINANSILFCFHFSSQRVYDDEDEEEDRQQAESKDSASKPAEVIDPLVILKNAFAAGQVALRLFYFDDNDNLEEKEEVSRLHFSLATVLCA